MQACDRAPEWCDSCTQQCFVWVHLLMTATILAAEAHAGGGCCEMFGVTGPLRYVPSCWTPSDRPNVTVCTWLRRARVCS